MSQRLESTAGAPGGAPVAILDSGGAAILRVTNLVKRYGDQLAVAGVSFEVEQGEVFGFLGPNGAGKSTTIAMLLGLVQPTAGSIEMFDYGQGHRDLALARVGAIIETPAFYPYLSGRQNLEVTGMLRGGIGPERVERVLEMVNLSDAASRQFGKYSLGMKQRLGIASTLLHDPDLIILDEPTNGLDPAGIIEVRDLIRDLANFGKSVFISSHLLNEVEQVCDRVAILQHGRTIAEGPVHELVGESTRVAIKTDQPERALSLLKGVAGVDQVEARDDDILVSGGAMHPSELASTLIYAGIALNEMKSVSSSLEEIFLELTNDNPDVNGATNRG